MVPLLVFFLLAFLLFTPVRVQVLVRVRDGAQWMARIYLYDLCIVLPKKTPGKHTSVKPIPLLRALYRPALSLLAHLNVQELYLCVLPGGNDAARLAFSTAIIRTGFNLLASLLPPTVRLHLYTRTSFSQKKTQAAFGCIIFFQLGILLLKLFSAGFRLLTMKEEKKWKTPLVN